MVQFIEKIRLINEEMFQSRFRNETKIRTSEFLDEKIDFPFFLSLSLLFSLRISSPPRDENDFEEGLAVSRVSAIGGSMRVCLLVGTSTGSWTKRLAPSITQREGNRVSCRFSCLLLPSARPSLVRASIPVLRRRRKKKKKKNLEEFGFFAPTSLLVLGTFHEKAFSKGNKFSRLLIDRYIFKDCVCVFFFINSLEKKKNK